MSHDVFAEPRAVTDIADCYFYHTMELPGHGLVDGEWDLRGREAAYLGHVNVAGKRVLEVGTASGHLCFTMEKLGASVVAYDLSDQHEWDIVPFAGQDVSGYIRERKEHIRKLNNSFWLAHRAIQSRARVVYGTVYDVPAGIGRFDVCTFGSILLHLRDPFLALQRITSLVDETVVVSEVTSRPGLNALLYGARTFIESATGIRLIRFLPSSRRGGPIDAWWVLSPQLVREYLAILGFPHASVRYHRQAHGTRLGGSKEVSVFTVVAHRKALPSR